MHSITPIEYAAMLQQGHQHILIDVREPWEFGLAHIGNAELKPLRSISAWSKELSCHDTYIIVCHHGIRSLFACEFLERLGFDAVYNLEGGIDASTDTGDPGMHKY